MKFIAKRDIYLQQVVCNEPESVKEITVPDGFELLCSNVFSRFVNVEKIVLPESLHSLEVNCFVGCKKLTTLVAPGITSIAEEYFTDCRGITELNLPATLKKIYPYSFYNLNGLKRVTFESIDDIEVRKNAFSSIPKAAEVVYPETSGKPVIPYSSDMGEYAKGMLKHEVSGLAPIVQLREYAALAAGSDGKPEYDIYNKHEVYLNTAYRAKEFIMDGDTLVGITFDAEIGTFKYERRTLLIGQAKPWYTSSEYDTSSDNNGAGYSETYDVRTYMTLVPKNTVKIR